MSDQVCEHCGSKTGKVLSGISKKNGRPWRGFKCSDCDAMTWLRDETSPGQPRGNQDKGHRAPARRLPPSASLPASAHIPDPNIKLDECIRRLKAVEELIRTLYQKMDMGEPPEVHVGTPLPEDRVVPESDIPY